MSLIPVLPNSYFETYKYRLQRERGRVNGGFLLKLFWTAVTLNRPRAVNLEKKNNENKTR